MADVELRSHFSRQNNLGRPDGSAAYCQGETVVQAAVYGPGEVRLQKELSTKALLEVVYMPKTGQPACAEKLRERLIRNTCDAIVLTVLHPRTAINVVLQEMHDDGSLLSCCINAACLALMDAGIEMKCLVAAATCAITQDGLIVLDPTREQEKEAAAMLTFAFESQKRNVVLTNTQGLVTDVQMQQCLQTCRNASRDIFRFYRSVTERRFTKESG